MGCNSSSTAAAVSRPGSIYVKRDDGNSYNGEYNDNGMMHGYGKMKYHNGDMYIGNWCENKFNGLGLYRFANGELHEGEYKEGKKNGLGKYTYPDGESFEGTYVDDMMSNGIYNFSNGDKYEGEFLMNRPNGRGKLTKNNEIFDGNFIDGNFVITTRKEDVPTVNADSAEVDVPVVPQQDGNII